VTGVSPRLWRGIDRAVRWRLGQILAQSHLDGALGEPPGRIDPREFWQASRVAAPVRLSAHERRRKGAVRVLDLAGPSDGPGDHPGSRRLRARAFLHGSSGDGLLVLLLHGYAAPVPYYEDYHARLLLRRGVSAARLDLPFHLGRRVRRRPAGHGFFSADASHTVAVIRQGVEDAAAVVAWAKREVTPRVAVLGFSLGGLVGCLLAAQIELDALVAVTPPCDLPAIVLEHSPLRFRRLTGISADGSGLFGADAATARRVLEEAMAPVVPRRLALATPPDRVTLVAALHDQIVGVGPVRDLASTWGTECWDYSRGHVTVLSTRGVTARLHDQLLRDRAGRPLHHALVG
jgi:predicted alpha/beta-hydrolase family hydrolase